MGTCTGHGKESRGFLLNILVWRRVDHTPGQGEEMQHKLVLIPSLEDGCWVFPMVTTSLLLICEDTQPFPLEPLLDRTRLIAHVRVHSIVG